jgi:NAD(P)-dependent dehydrogenase (short-subunit alcohol dehydrogenase family)
VGGDNGQHLLLPGNAALMQQASEAPLSRREGSFVRVLLPVTLTGGHNATCRWQELIVSALISRFIGRYLYMLGVVAFGRRSVRAFLFVGGHSSPAILWMLSSPTGLEVHLTRVPYLLVRGSVIFVPYRACGGSAGSAAGAYGRGGSLTEGGGEVTRGLERLRGKSAVVTGAAKGIGRATAELFAREGARLVVNDVDEDRLTKLRERLADSGVEVEAVVGDVSVVEDARRIIEAAVEEFGRIDVLVANAGVIPLNSIVDATPEDWEAVMAVDGRGMFLTCKYAVEVMLGQEKPGGSIICLSSISGVAGQAKQSTYGPAKFVASGITKHLAVEWADRGIRVNAVAPGTIATEAVAELPEEYKAPMKGAHPIGRLGEPSEVANAILFLASDEASFVTGAILPVDGGYLAQ